MPESGSGVYSTGVPKMSASLAGTDAPTAPRGRRIFTSWVSLEITPRAMRTLDRNYRWVVEPGAFRAFLAEVPSGGRWTQRFEPEVNPITDEPPCTGDLTLYLGTLAMLLSGSGLIACGIWERKERKILRFSGNLEEFSRT